MITPKQKWARERNFTVFRLKGMRAQLREMLNNSKCLTSAEFEYVSRAEDNISTALDKWKMRNFLSKGLFLKGEKK